VDDGRGRRALLVSAQGTAGQGGDDQEAAPGQPADGLREGSVPALHVVTSVDPGQPTSPQALQDGELFFAYQVDGFHLVDLTGGVLWCYDSGVP
jgi:hypothetical protein